MLLNQFGKQFHQPSPVRSDRGFSVAHIDQIAFVTDDGTQTADQSRPRLHAADPRVADFDGHDLSTGGDPVQFRMVGKVCGDDPGNVRSVSARIRHNRQSISVVVNIDGKVEERILAKAGVLTFVAVIGEHGFVAQVCILIRVNHGTPHVAVAKQDTVIQWPRIVGVLCGLLQLFEPRAQFISLRLLFVGRRRMLRVPGEDLPTNGFCRGGLRELESLSTFLLQRRNQSGREEVPSAFYANAELTRGILPRGVDSQLSSAQTFQHSVLHFPDGRCVHVSTAGPVDHVNDLGFSVRRGLQSGRTRVDARVKNCNHHTPSIIIRILLQEPQRAGLLLWQKTAGRESVRRVIGRARAGIRQHDRER